MRLRNVVWAACGALALAGSAMAQETVKLEYKLQPGTELIYKSSGTIQYASSGRTEEVTQSGPTRDVVADVDAATGVMLIAQLTTAKLASKASTAQGDQTQTQTSDEVSVFRAGRSGDSVVRKMKDEGKLPDAGAGLVWLLGRGQLEVMPLPKGTVSVGATWESSGEGLTRGIPSPASSKVASTLAEIKVVDGHKCAVIQSKVTPGDKESIAGLPDIAVSVQVETLFDVDGGFCRSVKSKLELKNGTESIESASVLDSVKALPPEEFARESKVIHALDAAVAAAYAGEYAKATDVLESLKPAEIPEAWKAGINKAIGTLKQVARMAAGG